MGKNQHQHHHGHHHGKHGRRFWGPRGGMQPPWWATQDDDDDDDDSEYQFENEDVESFSATGRWIRHGDKIILLGV